MSIKRAVSYLQKAIFDDVNWCNKVKKSWQAVKSELAQQADNKQSTPLSCIGCRHNYSQDVLTRCTNCIRQPILYNKRSDLYE